MVRSKLAAAILSASLALPGFASAIGVGDYTLKSYLNQPLDLEIGLIQTKDLTPDEIVANIASQEEFDRAGIERVFSLQDIRFEVVPKPDGTMTIVAHTAKPITEPFLNFLLEVRWPQGRMLREYTILLDPQVYKSGAAPATAAEPVTQPAEQPAAASVPAVAAPATTAPEVPPPAPAVQPAPVATSEAGLPPPPSGAASPSATAEPSVAATRPQPAPAAVTPSAAKAGEYRVQANDTMWQIAAQNRSAATVQQTMMAIQRANPDAFIKGNVNLVKKGAVLRIPGEAEVQQVSTSEARKEFASQTKAWRELLDQRGIAIAKPADKAALEAGKSVATHATPKGTGKGEVTLVAPTASGKGKASGGKDAEALQNQLAISEEGIAKATSENKALSTHLADLDKQIKASDKTLAMKTDQISGLQDELNRLRKEKDKAAEKAAAAAAASKTAAAEAAKPVATAPAAEAPKPAPAAAPEVTKAEAPKPEKKPAAQEPEEQPAPQSSGGSLLGLLAGGLALLGAAGGGFWFWRRRQANAGTAPAVAEDHDAQVADDLAQLQDLNASPEEHEAPAATHDAEGGGGDPLGEADMYVAYGRFQQAADILYAALQREPERGDIRVKLAEVYAEMGDVDSAREHATAAAGSGNADIRRQAEAVLAKVGGGGAAAHAAEEKQISLDDLALEFSGGGATAAAPAAADELSFDLDEPAPAATAKTPAVSAPKPKVQAPAEEESLDFSLDDIDMGEPAPAPAPKAAGSVTEVRAKQDFGDLSLDDSSFGDFKLEDEKPAAAPAAKEFDLSEEFSLEEAPAATEELTMEAPAFEEPDFAATTGAQAKLTDKMVAQAAPAAAPAPAASLDLESELADLHSDLKDEGVAASGSADDFDFLADSDENATKLDLAKAYIDMGDADGARDILNEVVAEGNATQKSEAQKLLAQVG